MAENLTPVPETAEEQPQETPEKTNFVKSFIAKHPNASKIAGVTAAVLAVVGVVVAVKSGSDEDDSEPLALNAGSDGSYLDPETNLVTEA